MGVETSMESEARNGAAFPPLEKLLHAYQRSQATAFTARIGAYLVAVHLIIVSALALWSMFMPLSATPLRLLAASYLVYLSLPVAYWIQKSSRALSFPRLAEELDHAHPSAPDPFRVSQSLGNHHGDTRRELEEMLSRSLPDLHLPKPRRISSWGIRLLFGAAFVFLLAGGVSQRPMEFSRRSFLPWVALRQLPVLRFQIDPVPLELAIGDTTHVSGRMLRYAAGQGVFAYVKVGTREIRYPLHVTSDTGFAFQYGPVEKDFSLEFSGANGSSSTLRFKVGAPPSFSRVETVILPPAYTRLKADTLPPGLGQFPVLPGTLVRWTVTSDRNLSALNFHTWSDSANASRRTDSLGRGRTFQISRTILESMNFAFDLRDEKGLQSLGFQPGIISLLPDAPPEAEWMAPGADTTIDRDGSFFVAARLKDDFGISSLKLSYTSIDGAKTPVTRLRDCRDWLKEAKGGVVAANWSLADLGLLPGQAVDLQWIVLDNDTVTGPKVGKSSVRRVRIATLDEVLATAHQREQSAESNLKSALQRERQLVKKLERQNQTPHEEGPPMLSDYEINRIMVDDPRENAKRIEAMLAQVQPSLSRFAKEKNHALTPAGSPNAASRMEASQMETAAKEIAEMTRKSEASLPHGNQSLIPPEERRNNLDSLMRQQTDQSDRLAAFQKKMEKLPPGLRPEVEAARAQLESVARELAKNRENQTDLKKLLQDQALQAKAKSDMLDQAIAEQMHMNQDVKSAVDDVNKSLQQGMKNGMLSKELLDKMQKVQDLLKEVIPDSLRRLMEQKMQGQEVDSKELQERLQQMLDKQSELSENLTRALAMLEQLKDKKRMQEFKQRLNELSAREKALQKDLESTAANPDRHADQTAAQPSVKEAPQEAAQQASQEAAQKSIQKDFEKSLADFNAQTAGKKGLEELKKTLQSVGAQADMQKVRDALAEARKSRSKASTAASQSAQSAAGKMASMAGELESAMQPQGEAIDIGEIQDMLEETLQLSRLQLTLRAGAAKRLAEGWTQDETALYGTIAQTADWLNTRVKTLAEKIPFVGSAMLASARNLSTTAHEAADHYSWEAGEQALKQTQNLSRELLKLLKMAQASGSGSGSGSGSSGGQNSGDGSSGGDMAGQLQGMSGKQMAINQATYKLLQSMLQSRQGSGRGQQPGKAGPGPDGQSPDGQSPGGQAPGGQAPAGQSPGGQNPGGNGSEGGEGASGTSLANQQGELGEKLEGLAEGMDEGGGAAQKIRSLADEARKLEEDLRQGRFSPEDLRRRQERFQSRLLDASNAFQERGQSEKRQGETARGNPGTALDNGPTLPEARILQMLREARKGSKALRLNYGQRKYLDEYYESMLTR